VSFYKAFFTTPEGQYLCLKGISCKIVLKKFCVNPRPDLVSSDICVRLFHFAGLAKTISELNALAFTKKGLETYGNTIHHQ
jgi:hypothetical protein